MAKMLAPKETGSWWVKGPKLCQKWKSWYDGKTLCFTINKTGKSTISWKRDDGLAGTARIRGLILLSPLPSRSATDLTNCGVPLPQSGPFPDIFS